MPTAGRDSEEFYANAAIGEFWTGPRPSLAHVAADLGLADPAARRARPRPSRDEPLDAVVLRDADPAVTTALDAARSRAREDWPLDTDIADLDARLLRDLSELRLVKDSTSSTRCALAIDATKRGFDDVIADLPNIVAHERGERLVEGTFNRRARADGNTVGYDTIAASGPHACILHWTRNDGPVVPGDLILLDAGVEVESLTPPTSRAPCP